MTVRKAGAKAPTTDLDIEENLSQPTFEEHRVTDSYAWPPMQDHGYAYYSDCLAQDMSQEQLGNVTMNKPIFVINIHDFFGT